VRAIKFAHLAVGAALLVFAVFSGAWMLGIAGIAFAALGWFGVCPMVRIAGRLQH
jgi:Protein of unknown function (DUF2892)